MDLGFSPSMERYLILAYKRPSMEGRDLSADLIIIRDRTKNMIISSFIILTLPQKNDGRTEGISGY